MFQLIFITFCILNLNSTFMILISKQEYWMGCYFLLQGMFLAQGLNLHLLLSCAWQAGSLLPVPPGKPNFSSLCCVYSGVSSPLRPYALQNTRLLCPWDFLGKNTGVGCHFLLQGIFLTQGSTKCDKNRSINSQFMKKVISHKQVYTKQHRN